MPQSNRWHQYLFNQGKDPQVVQYEFKAGGFDQYQENGVAGGVIWEE
jgi:hypothetical protein